MIIIINSISMLIQMFVIIGIFILVGIFIFSFVDKNPKLSTNWKNKNFIKKNVIDNFYIFFEKITKEIPIEYFQEKDDKLDSSIYKFILIIFSIIAFILIIPMIINNKIDWDNIISLSIAMIFTILINIFSNKYLVKFKYLFKFAYSENFFYLNIGPERKTLSIYFKENFYKFENIKDYKIIKGNILEITMKNEKILNINLNNDEITKIQNILDEKLQK